MSDPVFAFTPKEAAEVERLLGNLVRSLRAVPGGGKIEEDYWSHIYRKVKGAPDTGWSNLPMRDYAHGGLGVEMKLLKRRSPLADQGRRLMHPAATRTITYDPQADAETCKVQVLRQFGTQIAEFRERVAKTKPGCQPDIRWGVFLWSPSLTEFLYFEERMEEPDPDAFTARFVEQRSRGATTKNLHIFERDTGIKRYSVTSPEKGAKVQPYFDVPRIGRGAYGFIVPDDGRQAVWLRPESAAALERIARGQDIDDIIAEALRALEQPAGG